MLHNYTITKNNLHIENSCEVSKRYFRRTLLGIENLRPDSDVWKRSKCGMSLEWSAHNGLYMIGYKRDHTKDVDLDYPQTFWEKFKFTVVGIAFWPFID